MRLASGKAIESLRDLGGYSCLLTRAFHPARFRCPEQQQSVLGKLFIKVTVQGVIYSVKLSVDKFSFTAIQAVTTSALSTGNHSIAASYLGSASFTGSASGAMQEVIAGADEHHRYFGRRTDLGGKPRVRRAADCAGSGQQRKPRAERVGDATFTRRWPKSHNQAPSRRLPPFWTQTGQGLVRNRTVKKRR
jgi:hypothetical protein